MTRPLTLAPALTAEVEGLARRRLQLIERLRRVTPSRSGLTVGAARWLGVGFALGVVSVSAWASACGVGWKVLADQRG